MAFVRFIDGRCSDPRYEQALSRDDYVKLDSSPKRGNVLVRFSQGGSPIHIPLTPAMRDLVDLAASIYVADELVPRVEATDHWSRILDLLVPVRTPSSWEAADDELRDCLGFVSGDSYRFTWCGYSSIVRWPTPRQRLRGRFDAVCLFSGGMDSLLGAWTMLSEGKRLLLVGHQAEGTTASAQTEIAQALDQRFPGAVTFVQVRVSQAGGASPRHALPDLRGPEQTHRPRSFLFLSLAVALANAVGASLVVIPENGLIALNPPLQTSRTGSLSTRTAHPTFLRRFRDWLRAAQLFAGDVRNPFLYESKTDLLRREVIGDDLLRRLLVRSVSCSRPFLYKEKRVRHCGYCVPCLFRRASMFEAGLDSPSQYAFDVFTQLETMTAVTREDFNALVPFARGIVASTSLGLARVVLAHGAFPSDIGQEVGPHGATDYSPWTTMLRNWAEHFLSYAAIAGNARSPRRRMVRR